ncbi:hypothetical protein AC579_1349 [Pseudocercospora musae]|uniref:Cytochrome P450 n=1 Tax=Pseudocercospora musae TaxID=113226 RepID=A0A139INZ1_9PEZI|nr:hypothetical protein AC579_1349 [Pseudocercospora musae]
MEESHLVVTAIALLIALVYWFVSIRPDPLKHIPLVGEGSRRKRIQAYHFGAKKIFADACEKVLSAWRMTDDVMDRALTVLQTVHIAFSGRDTRSLVNEYNSVPEDVFSPHAPFDQFVEKAITDINITSRALIYSVRQDLTPSLALSEVANGAVLSTISKCSEWSEVDLHHSLISIVTIVSGWVFVGPEYSATKEYMDLAASYAADAFGGPKMLQLVPQPLRPIAAVFMPPLRRVKRFHQRIFDLLGPGIDRRRKELAEGRLRSADMLDWLIVNAHRFPDDIRSDYDIARVQQSLSAVAIHTTALTALATIFDLACEPKIVEDLRAEIDTVLAAHDGKVTARSLYEMKLLDALMCEIVSARRKALKPYVFSDGTRIPAGTMLAVPVYTIARDQAHFSDPEKFDPYRFTKAREGGNNDHLQFASVTHGTMAFGCGKHACPGRFFAALEIKLILIHLLKHFDVKAKPGQDGVTRRYGNMEYDSMVSMKRSDSAQVWH